MNQFKLTPDLSGYGAQLGEAVLRTQGQYGLPRQRADGVNAPHLVQASITLKTKPHNYLLAFYRQNRAKRFTANLLTDKAEVVAHECQFASTLDIHPLGAGVYQTSFTLLVKPLPIDTASDVQVIADFNPTSCNGNHDDAPTSGTGDNTGDETGAGDNTGDNTGGGDAAAEYVYTVTGALPAPLFDGTTSIVAVYAIVFFDGVRHPIGFATNNNTEFAGTYDQGYLFNAAYTANAALNNSANSHFVLQFDGQSTPKVAEFYGINDATKPKLEAYIKASLSTATLTYTAVSKQMAFEPMTQAEKEQIITANGGAGRVKFVDLLGMCGIDFGTIIDSEYQFAIA